ncbi:MAG: hypothetical protein KKE17_07940 [Proteobacteria bacterium]|nr:hypothetical protein [Pseudomonadota bacterium]MBU1709917.1 hypothetical protein [Pseudomonadota bacterium]
MDKNGSPTRESLTTEIDDAVDDLFSEFEQIEIDPLTSEVMKTASATEDDQDTLIFDDESFESSLELESDNDLGQQDVLETADDLLSQSDHAILSLEWEVSPETIQHAKDSLTELQGKFEREKTPGTSEALSLMNGVLDALLASPLTVPTSAPKTLKKTLDILKKISLENLSKDAIQSSLGSVLSELKAAQPKTEELHMELEKESSEDQPDDFNLVAEGDKGTLVIEGQEDDTLTLSQADENTKQLKSPDQKSIRPKKRVEEKRVAAPAPRLPGTSAIPDELGKVIQSNVVMLGRCIDRIMPLEQLFARTPGYDKLHLINKKLREQLEIQRDSLANALGGDFSSLPPQQGAPIQKTRISQQSSGESPCPWSKLTVAKWKGSFVAFLVEQVAYVSDNQINAYEKFKNRQSFPLKNLKSWPWSKLKPLLGGDISTKTDAELKSMMLPILDHPGVFQNFAEPADENFIMLLSHHEIGGVVFLDSQTNNINVSQQWLWEANPQKSSVLAGHLQIHGEFLPVVDVSRLES